MAPVLLKLKIHRIFISMKELLSTILLTFAVVFSYAQASMDGGVWKDKTGKHINAHG